MKLNAPTKSSMSESDLEQISNLGFVKKMEEIKMMNKVFVAFATLSIIDQAVSFAIIGTTRC